MRKYITIVGVGKRMQGTSQKNGKGYDFTPVSFTYEDPYVHGVKAASCNISQSNMGDYSPAVGDVVDAVFSVDRKTGVHYVEAII